jgi:hypothetical protein
MEMMSAHPSQDELSAFGLGRLEEVGDPRASELAFLTFEEIDVDTFEGRDLYDRLWRAELGDSGYYVAYDRAAAFGLTAGVLAGLGILTATIWLWLRLWRRGRLQADQDLEAMIKLVQKQFPRECQLLGGALGLREPDIVQDYVRKQLKLSRSVD